MRVQHSIDLEALGLSVTAGWTTRLQSLHDHLLFFFFSCLRKIPSPTGRVAECGCVQSGGRWGGPLSFLTISYRSQKLREAGSLQESHGAPIYASVCGHVLRPELDWKRAEKTPGEESNTCTAGHLSRAIFHHQITNSNKSCTKGRTGRQHTHCLETQQGSFRFSCCRSRKRESGREKKRKWAARGPRPTCLTSTSVSRRGCTNNARGR